MRTILQTGVCAVFTMLAASGPAPAVEKEDVDKAVQRGVLAVHRGQTAQGTWGGFNGIGLTSLAALTLLECDVETNDPAIKLAAKAVRAGAVTETQTYSLALAILFLDRLGDPVDVALIESLTIRLLAGQKPTGDWSYTCAAPAKEDQDRLSQQVKEASELKGRRELPKASQGTPDADNPSEEKKRLAPEKVTEILGKAMLLARTNPAPAETPDFSNTQFAALGLWVARRHGLPVERALAGVGKRFRATQNRDGGWPYNLQMGVESTATMTAAGTLCLAIVDATVNDVNRGKDPKAPPVLDIRKDINLGKGLGVLGAVIDHPAAKKREHGLPAQIPQVAGKTYYFLWTLERIGVALDLNTIGNKDWYNWGAEILLANQQEDGNWKGEFLQADTCFALLFLRRANLAKDLTASLKGKLGDETTLKSGGVGGDGLKGPAMKSPVEIKNEAKGLEANTERGKLAKEVVEASGVKQDKLIEKYRDEKGVTYTEALAAAIPHLNGEAKNKARDALAERLSRMKADTLTNYLKDEEAEIRRAAALACALKESKAHIPQLIEMLRDKDPIVERGVLAALKDLSGQNFGPAANASAADRAKAVAAWQEWWKKQQK